MSSRVVACLSAVLFAAVALCGGWPRPAAAQATLPAGQWQGTLQSPQPSRVLLLLDSASASPGQGVVYLLDDDNPDWPHATSAFKLDSTSVSFRIVNIDVNFQGKLAADGTLAGTWQQHGTRTPITLAHTTGDAAWPVPAPTGKSMAANADPAFDVVTIKPADPSDTGTGFQTIGQRLHVRNESLEAIVSVAYKIHPGQIQGAPGWFASQRWEIDGLPTRRASRTWTRCGPCTASCWRSASPSNSTTRSAICPFTCSTWRKADRSSRAASATRTDRRTRQEARTTASATFATRT